MEYSAVVSCEYSLVILTLNLLMTTIVAPPTNASKWQMGFNSAFKGLNERELSVEFYLVRGMNISDYRL